MWESVKRASPLPTTPATPDHPPGREGSGLVGATAAPFSHIFPGVAARRGPPALLARRIGPAYPPGWLAPVGFNRPSRSARDRWLPSGARTGALVCRQVAG